MANGFKFNVDLSEVIEEFSLGASQIKALTRSILDDVTQAIYREWKQAARRELSSTRQDYIRGLQVINEGPLKNTIILKGKLNNMLEYGVGSFDMKSGFSRSPKVRISKSGNWYLTIPFRQATPGALGESAAFSGVMPKEVYEAVRAAEKSGFKSLRREDIPKAFADILSNKTSGYKHKSSIYEGIGRSSTFYEQVTQSQYSSFRRVGAKSDPKAWIHAGLRQYNFAEKALQSTNAQVIVDNAVDTYLASL